MTDNLTKEQRSFNMSRILSTHNASTEEYLLRLLKEQKLSGWRRSFNMIGRPDFVFPKSRVAVFVDGCYWHGCPKCSLRAKSNLAYWSMKIEGNRLRDRTVTQELRRKGWHVVRIWEHALRHHPRISINRILRALERQNGALAKRGKSLPRSFRDEF